MDYSLTVSSGGYAALRSSGVYDMTDDKGRRRSPRRSKAAEERILTQLLRDRGTATIYDMIRNDPVVAWGFGKFLDYATVQYFAARTDDSMFNDELERVVADWSLAHNCDVAGRNDFDNLIRIFGGALALDGDNALLKITGGKLQGIESDRIRSTGYGNKKIPASINGVIVDPSTGRAKQYLLFDRNQFGWFVFNRAVNAENMIFRGNFIRFDQVRGVPLLAPAVNTFQDAKETDEYQRIKSKNHAALAVAVTSKKGSGLGDLNLLNNTGAATTEEASSAYGVYDMDVATKLELDEGDDVQFLESHTPSNEYQTFNDSLIRRGLLVFGLAFSFYNSEKSSYSSMKQDRAEFKFSIQRYMRMMISARSEVMQWVLPQLINDNGLKWSKSGNPRFEWIPQADPWLEEDKEVSSALDRIAGGLSSPQRECKRRGVDAFDILRENAEYQREVRNTGTVYSIGNPGGNLFNSGNMNISVGGANA